MVFSADKIDVASLVHGKAWPIEEHFIGINCHSAEQGHIKFDGTAYTYLY